MFTPRGAVESLDFALEFRIWDVNYFSKLHRWKGPKTRRNQDFGTLPKIMIGVIV